MSAIYQPGLLLPGMPGWIAAMSLGRKNGHLTKRPSTGHLAKHHCECWIKPKSCLHDSDSPLWVVACPSDSGDIIIQIKSDHCYYINQNFTRYTSVPAGYTPEGYTEYAGTCDECEDDATEPYCPYGYVLSPEDDACACAAPDSASFHSWINPILLLRGGSTPGGCFTNVCVYHGPVWNRNTYSAGGCTGFTGTVVTTGVMCVGDTTAGFVSAGLARRDTTFAGAEDRDSFLLDELGTTPSCTAPNDVHLLYSMAALAVW